MTSFAAHGVRDPSQCIVNGEEHPVVTLTFDPDIQTRPSEGPNTSTMGIWRKSVQPFPKYFIQKQKKQNEQVTDRAKKKPYLHAVTTSMHTPIVTYTM